MSTQNTKDRFDDSVEFFKKSIHGVHSRASSSLLDAIRCEAYGSLTPISQCGNVSVIDAKTLSVQVWDETLAGVVYKAIQQSNISGNPSLAGSTIIIPFPPMSEERRRDMSGIVKKNLEEARVAIRAVRHDERDKIKTAEKAKEISEDDVKRQEKELDKYAEEASKAVEELYEVKIKELEHI